MTDRVQKVLSQWGIASRRKAEQMIVAGRVRVNGKTAKLGDRVDVAVDLLEVDNKVVRSTHRPQPIYLLLNKPVGVVSTCFDPQNRSTVIDLLPSFERKGIHPVGRLDLASSGALILTNDGEFTLGLTHPRYHLPKTYIVELDRSLGNEDLASWRRGIILDGRKTLPAKVSPLSSNKAAKTIEIVLNEGRNRQIRRVARQLGYRVQKLHRIAIGSITLSLDNNLELSPGKYRHLKQTEINFLKNFYNPKYLKATAQPGSAVYEQRSKK